MSYELTEDDCVIDSFYGTPHPYNFCIKPASEVMRESIPPGISCEAWGTECIEYNMIGFGKYSESLFANPSQILDPSCQDDSDKNDIPNTLGNKYVIKTSSKCKTINGDLVPRHIYINNTSNNEIFGAPMLSENSGILPASLSKASRINGSGFFNSLIEDSIPDCSQVRVKCHLLDKYKNKYSGKSPLVNIAVNEIDTIRNSDNIILEGFSNLNNNNIILDNNNIINDVYYLLIGIIILYIIFKMIHKK